MRTSIGNKAERSGVIVDDAKRPSDVESRLVAQLHSTTHDSVTCQQQGNVVSAGGTHLLWLVACSTMLSAKHLEMDCSQGHKRRLAHRGGGVVPAGVVGRRQLPVKLPLHHVSPGVSMGAWSTTCRHGMTCTSRLAIQQHYGCLHKCL